LIRRVAVIVPAANEERRIGRCLSAIALARSQLDRSGADVSVQVFVVLDGCHDATAEIAAAFGDLQLVTISARSVGAARRAGALAALSGADRGSEVWLAHTDADSEVPADWLTVMVAEARRGAHLVLGTVLPGTDPSWPARAEWLSRHHLREGHPHVHGANFGIRGDSYRTLGGWQPLLTGEDVDLASRAALAPQLRITRTARIPVVTSVRQVGRAPRGFSSYLRALAVRDRSPRVGAVHANDTAATAAHSSGAAAAAADAARARPAAASP
jgi:glycosyltransferase involved in cell wall biosynthesis